MKKSVTLMFGLALMWGSESLAATCKFKGNTDTDWSQGTQILMEYDLGDVPGLGLDDSEDACMIKGQAKILTLSLSSYGTAACSAGLPNNAIVYGVSRSGLTGSRLDGQIGKVVRVSAVYSCPSGSSLSGTNCTAAFTANCPSGYWLEGASVSALCVKQVVSGGVLPGVPAWNSIGSGTLSGRSGEYKTDDQGGVRHFSTSNRSCPSGFTLIPGTIPFCQKAATLVTPASCSMVK